MYVLVVETGKYKGKRIKLAGAELLIGRDEDAGIRIGSDDVSRRHCLLKPAADGVYVHDLESRNGTFVDGVPIGAGADVLLRPGSSLTVGPMSFQLASAGMKRPARRPDAESLSDDDIRAWLTDSDTGEMMSSADTTIITGRSTADSVVPPAAVEPIPPAPKKREYKTLAEEAAEIIRLHRESLGEDGEQRSPRSDMRIIAGRFRRRQVLAVPGDTTRPITDRVKETLFERIEQSLRGARIADVFAGTGTMALEALSRGSVKAVCIEQDRRAVEMLRTNVAALGLVDDVICWPTNVLRTSFRPQRAEGFLPYDVVFFDPPYKLAPQLVAGAPLYRALERLARDDVSAEAARLVLRVPERSEVELPAAWRPDWELAMSSMRMMLFTRLAGAQSPAMALPSDSDGPASGDAIP